MVVLVLSSMVWCYSSYLVGSSVWEYIASHDQSVECAKVCTYLTILVNFAESMCAQYL